VTHGGEVKEKLANGVSSLHSTSEHGQSSITYLLHGAGSFLRS